MQLLINMFLLFTRVALFSWGGGPASLALMQREVVAAGWMSSVEFADAVALGNALPGPIAPQVSAWVGYKIAGLTGAIAATVGTVVPTTALMLLMVAFAFSAKDSSALRSMLSGVRPVVVGLLAWTAYDMGRAIFCVPGVGRVSTFAQAWLNPILAIVAFVVLTFTKVNPALLILGAGMFGLIFLRQ